MPGRRKTNCSIAACRAEFALYLLPNAKAIRLVESGSLLHLLHKWTMRTCFNAQEEIYQASMEEVAQVRAALPEIGRYIGPPCYVRAGIASAHLHGRLAFLRHQSVAGVSQHRAAHMTPPRHAGLLSCGVGDRMFHRVAAAVAY